MPFFLLLIAISVLICKLRRLSPETPSSFSVNNTAAPARRALPAAYLQGYRSPAGAAAAASPPDRLLRHRPRRGAFGKAPAAALAAGTAAPATQPPPGTPSSGAGPAAQRDPPPSPRHPGPAPWEPRRRRRHRSLGQESEEGAAGRCCGHRIRPGTRSAEAVNAPPARGVTQRGERKTRTPRGRDPGGRCCDPKGRTRHGDAAEAWEDAGDAGSPLIPGLLRGFIDGGAAVQRFPDTLKGPIITCLCLCATRVISL